MCVCERERERERERVRERARERVRERAREYICIRGERDESRGKRERR